MLQLNSQLLLILLIVLVVLMPSEAWAFGAGNIPSYGFLEGKAFRHGDIADTLADLAKTAGAGGIMGVFKLGGGKFSKLDIQRVYFGNWLRDFSQSMDVGALSKISRDQVMNLVIVMGFLSIGYGTQEFRVTEERLGVIDNPKGYPSDAQKYHPKLRGPVQEIELQIDPRTGMKNYIRNEQGNWATSAGFIRQTLVNCIETGRRYRQSNNDNDQYEAFRLLGQALHTLEDFTAHSNFLELALIQLGYHHVFPHVGDHCLIQDPRGNRVYPLVTGSFGSSDFMFSLLGEAQDKISEASINDLHREIDSAKQRDASYTTLMELFDQVPGSGNDMKRDMQNIRSMDRTNADKLDSREINSVLWQVLEFRDNVMKMVSTTIEKIPGLNWLCDKIGESLTVFVLNTIEPYIVPVISKVMTGLQTASWKVLENPDQFKVFTDPYCSDPTHSMLSKDHFGLVLNEPAGLLAQIILKHTVKDVVQAWSDASNPHAAVDHILECFFHPAFQNPGSQIQTEMISKLSEWARNNSTFIQRLDKESVRQGRNTRSGKAQGHGGCHHNDGSSPSLMSAFGGKRRGIVEQDMGQPPAQAYQGSAPGMMSSSSYNSQMQYGAPAPVMPSSASSFDSQAQYGAPPAQWNNTQAMPTQASAYGHTSSYNPSTTYDAPQNGLPFLQHQQPAPPHSMNMPGYSSPGTYAMPQDSPSYPRPPNQTSSQFPDHQHY